MNDSDYALVTVDTRFPAVLHRRMKDRAEEWGVSMSWIVNKAVGRFLLDQNAGGREVPMRTNEYGVEHIGGYVVVILEPDAAWSCDWWGPNDGATRDVLAATEAATKYREGENTPKMPKVAP